MQAREESLRRHFAQRPCKVCHHRQTPETVLVLVRRPRAWVVMAVCARCQHRGIFLVSIPSPKRQPAAGTVATPNVSTRDVVEMRSFLDTFDGDFLSLFGAGPHGRFAAD
jgi:hypothetical protein